MSSSGCISTKFQDTTVPPSATALDRKGSRIHAASTCLLARAAGASGKATSTNFTLLGSPPSFSMTDLIVVSPMLERLFTETVLPARSFGGLDARPGR